jgi:aspartate dehydrogenase
VTKIGIIGCGAIGTAVAKAINRKFSRRARLAYVSDIDSSRARRLRSMLRSDRPRAVSNLELIAKSDLVVEAASAEAALEAVPIAVRRGKQILVLSVGGLLRIKNLPHLLARSTGYVHVPSGAVSGIDAVLAAKKYHISKLRITTRKPLRSLIRSPFFSRKPPSGRRIRKPTLIFQGNALEAIKQFPENVNVAATLSLAGIGPRRTRVRVYASPTYRNNTHEVEFEGRFGRVTSRMANLPSRANGKTSKLAIGSAIATIEKIFAQMKIGT